MSIVFFLLLTQYSHPLHIAATTHIFCSLQWYTICPLLHAWSSLPRRYCTLVCVCTLQLRAGVVLLMVTAVASAAMTRQRFVRDPPSPDQPADFVVSVANYCNTTMTLDPKNQNLWEGTFAVVPVRVCVFVTGHRA